MFSESLKKSKQNFCSKYSRFGIGKIGCSMTWARYKTQLITKIYFGHFWTTQIKMFLKLVSVLSQSLLRLLIFIPWFCKTPQNTCWKHTGLSLALPRPAGPGVNLEQTKDKPVCFLQLFWGALQNQWIKWGIWKGLAKNSYIHQIFILNVERLGKITNWRHSKSFFYVKNRLIFFWLFFIEKYQFKKQTIFTTDI